MSTLLNYPKYPEFKKLELGDKDFICRFNKQFPAYSDFNLLSALSWDASHSNCWSVLNNNLVWKIKDYLSDGFNYSILGESDIDNSLNLLLKTVQTLIFVPEVVVNKIENLSNFDVIEDRDNFDYILSTKNVTELVGARFRHLRQDINKFKREFPNYVVSELNLKEASIQKQIIELNNHWYKNKNFDQEKIIEENTIFDNFFSSCNSFDLLNIGIYVESTLIAYMLNEVIDHEVAVSHFSASTRSSCNASMVTYETASHLYAKGIQYQNLEQDTGLEGLRKTKMLYSPEFFLKKYTITKKES